MLCESSTLDRRRPTLLKNVLSPNLRKLRIIESDSYYIMTLIDRSIHEALIPQGFRPIVFDFKFGQRDLCSRVRDLYDLTMVETVSVHSAVNFKYENCHLFWSREAIREFLGNRSPTIPALGFTECANFQSILDGRPLNMKFALMNCFENPDRITFLQLYADSPHLRYKSTYHPVSGIIACGGLLHHQSSAAIARHANEYVDVMKNNADQLCGIMQSRMEIVERYDRDSISSMSSYPEFSYNRDGLMTLVTTYPMFVPFADFDSRFITSLHLISLQLVATLSDLLCTKKHSGVFFETWKAYQIELALEVRKQNEIMVKVRQFVIY